MGGGGGQCFHTPEKYMYSKVYIRIYWMQNDLRCLFIFMFYCTTIYGYNNPKSESLMIC